MVEIQALLTQLVERRGSDLLLISGSSPCLRVDGRLVRLDGPLLTSNTIHRWLNDLYHSGDMPAFDLSPTGSPPDRVVEVRDVGRFRCHAYRQSGEWAAMIRAIPLHPPSFKDLGLPPVLGSLIQQPQGLILLTGPTSCGKTTTVAAMIGKINAERRVHILTLERPVEFRHGHRKSVVSQRSIGADVADWSEGLAAIRRENPEVVVFGEVDRPEVLDAALVLAESGHLVFGVLEAVSSVQALHRLLETGPSDRVNTVRVRLASVLQGLVSQVLVPRVHGAGRLVALEILIPTPAVRNLLREDKIPQVYSIMQTGQAKHGMQTLNQALVDLYRRRLISASSAVAHAYAVDELHQLLQRADLRMRPHVARSAG